MSVTSFQGFSILVASRAIGHESTFIHMSPPGLKGRRCPSNWHLSVTQAELHRQVHNNGWWAAEQHKQRGNRGGCLKDKEERVGGWVGGWGRGGWGGGWVRSSKRRWDFWSLLETPEDESAAARCLVFLARHCSFWFVSMCLWCCWACLLLSISMIRPSDPPWLFPHSRCSYFAPTCAQCWSSGSTLSHTHRAYLKKK